MADTTDITGQAAPVVNQSTEQLKTEQPQTADPNLEAFAKKERMLRREQQKMQQERQAWETQRKQYETDYISKARLKTDAMTILQEEGIDYNTLTEQALQMPNDPATKALMNKIKVLEDRLNQSTKASEDQVTQQYEQAVKQIGTEVRLLIDSDVEFETIKQTGMQEAVTELIKETFNTEGYLMEVAEAAKQVESYLVEEGYKLGQSKKVQSRLKPVEVPTAQNPAQKQQISGMKTLTNNLPSQPAKRSSEKERRERAMLAFKGQLK